MSQNGSARQRARRSAGERAALVESWVKSGMSAQAFERRHGLSKGSLWRWHHASQLEPEESGPEERAAISFAPVHITKTQFDASVGERVVAEVVVGRDVRVRVLDGADADQVTRLVRALAGSVPC